MDQELILVVNHEVDPSKNKMMHLFLFFAKDLINSLIITLSILYQTHR